MENPLPWPAAKALPNTTTDLMNSRRCIQPLKVTFEGTRFPGCVQGWVQECFLYTLVATTVACGESDPKLLGLNQDLERVERIVGIG